MEQRGTAGAGLSTGLDSVGSNPHDDQHQLDIPGKGFTLGGVAVDVESGVGLGDAGDGGVGVDLDAVLDEFVVDEGAEFDLDGRKDLGQHLDLGDLDAAHREAFGHLESDVPGADDELALGLNPVEGRGECEGVAHRVQQVDAIGGVEGVEAFDERADGDAASADDERVVVDEVVAAVGVADGEASIESAQVSRRSFMPVASRSAWVRWARLRQWVTSPET